MSTLEDGFDFTHLKPITSVNTRYLEIITDDKELTEKQRERLVAGLQNSVTIPHAISELIEIFGDQERIPLHLRRAVYHALDNCTPQDLITALGLLKEPQRLRHLAIKHEREGCITIARQALATLESIAQQR